MTDAHLNWVQTMYSDEMGVKVIDPDAPKRSAEDEAVLSGWMDALSGRALAEYNAAPIRWIRDRVKAAMAAKERNGRR